MKKLKKIISVMICMLLVLAIVNIAHAQENASNPMADSFQGDDLGLQLSAGTMPNTMLRAGVSLSSSMSPSATSGIFDTLNTKSLMNGSVYTLQFTGENIAGDMGRPIAQIEKDATAAPITAIALPANNAHIYNTYTVTGTVSEAKTSSWELDYGAGSSPKFWNKINSGTGSIINGTIGTWYIASFPDGSVYTLKLTSTDLAGNTQATTSTITIDSTIAPYTDMSIPNNTSYINGTVTVLGTISGKSLSSWKLDYGIGNSPTKWAVLTTGTTPMSNGVVCQWDTGLLKNGELYTVRLSCTDQSGNYNQITKHLTKDITIPTTSISSPATNEHISGIYTVAGSVSGTNLDYWELCYGEGTDPAYWTKINSGITPVTNGKLGAWNTSTLSKGSVYSLQLTVADLAGHRIQSVSQVTIDSVSNPTSASNTASAPIITIASPANNSNVKGIETVTGTVSDTNMGRWTLEFGSGASPAKWTEINSGLTYVSNGTLGAWDTSMLATGIYTLRLSEVDIRGNTQQTTAQVTVGPLAASSGISTPENNSNASGATSAAPAATDTNKSSGIAENIKNFLDSLGSFFQQAYKWITGNNR